MKFEKIKETLGTSWYVSSSMPIPELSILHHANGLERYLPYNYRISERFGEGPTKEEALKEARSKREEARTKSIANINKLITAGDNFSWRYLFKSNRNAINEAKAKVHEIAAFDLDTVEIAEHSLESWMTIEDRYDHITEILRPGTELYLVTTYNKLDIETIYVKGVDMGAGALRYDTVDANDNGHNIPRVSVEKDGLKTSIYGQDVFLTMEEAKAHMSAHASEKIKEYQEWV